MAFSFNNSSYFWYFLFFHLFIYFFVLFFSFAWWVKNCLKMRGCGKSRLHMKEKLREFSTTSKPCYEQLNSWEARLQFTKVLEKLLWTWSNKINLHNGTDEKFSMYGSVEEYGLEAHDPRYRPLSGTTIALLSFECLWLLLEWAQLDNTN